jgi:hypothetical protein
MNDFFHPFRAELLPNEKTSLGDYGKGKIIHVGRLGSAVLLWLPPQQPCKTHADQREQSQSPQTEATLPPNTSAPTPLQPGHNRALSAVCA